jgi:hypothetical protein
MQGVRLWFRMSTAAGWLSCCCCSAAVLLCACCVCRRTLPGHSCNVVLRSLLAQSRQTF